LVYVLAASLSLLIDKRSAESARNRLLAKDGVYIAGREFERFEHLQPKLGWQV
jgi:hypothetical protein